MRPRALYTGLVVGWLAAGQARAEPPGMSPNPVPADPPPHKSPALALGLGIGFTAAGAAAMAVDAADGPELAPAGFLTMYIGPSIGRWYGGGSAVVGLIGRTAAIAVLLGGINEREPDTCIPDAGEGETCEDENEARADYDRNVRTRFVVAGTLWFGSTIYDFIMAPLDARDFNRQHALAVVPMPTPGGAGLALSGRF